MKKLSVYLLGLVLVLSLTPITASAYQNATLCYNYEDGKYEECSHAHVTPNYGVTPVYQSYNDWCGTNSGVYPRTTVNRVATQTYTKPVTRYVCEYDYYYGNKCYYKTDYVKSYREVPVYNTPVYSNYNNYSNYGNYNNYNGYYGNTNYTSTYNYSNYNTNRYSYPYNYSNFGYNYPYSYNYNTAYNYSY